MEKKQLAEKIIKHQKILLELFEATANEFEELDISLNKAIELGYETDTLFDDEDNKIICVVKEETAPYTQVVYDRLSGLII